MVGPQPVIIEAARPVVLCDALRDNLDGLVESAKAGRVCRSCGVCRCCRSAPSARRDDILDFGFEPGVEGYGVARQGRRPKAAWEDFLNFLLYSHPLLSKGGRCKLSSKPTALYLG
jgi:hypothetical protein